MGFLILGPMLDIKNVYILKQYMPTSFILRLGITIVIMSYITALGFSILCRLILVITISVRNKYKRR